jgi:solute carrier family 66 (lysosomal lysine-arginine transporter), member 1
MGGRRRPSHRRASSFARSDELLAGIVEEPRSIWLAVLKNVASVLGVCVVGAVGWTVAWKAGVWAPPVPDEDAGADGMGVGPQVLGYISAVCYLGARIPQIVKNHRDRSCEGLSLLFFILSVMGNLTYGLGVSVA